MTPACILYQPAPGDPHGFCALGKWGARPSLAGLITGLPTSAWGLFPTPLDPAALVLKWDGETCSDSMDRANRILRQVRRDSMALPWGAAELLVDVLVHYVGGTGILLGSDHRLLEKT